MKKQNEGITLVALIVTIIVLLILSAITLNFVLGENGIIEKARLASERTDEAQDKEEEELLELENKLNSYTRTSENQEIGYYNFKEGNNCGFTNTRGTIQNNSLGMIPITYENINGIDIYQSSSLICKEEKILEKTIEIDDKFEVSSEISFDNRVASNMGGIIIKLYKKTNENYEDILSMRVTDNWQADSTLVYEEGIGNTLFCNLRWATVNGSGRYAFVGDGSKIYFYKDNILLGSTDYEKGISIDKIEILFYGYDTARVAPPMIIKDLYIGKPKFYKTIFE